MALPTDMKLNLGCGSVHFEGWDNFDVEDYGQNIRLDIYHSPINRFTNLGPYEYIFCNHLLSCFSHHELPVVLGNIHTLLEPGGVAHILVPDARKAINAYIHGDAEWFPLGDDLPGVDERFCTFLPWFGESLSIFTAPYLLGLGQQAGFSKCEQVRWGTDEHDDREREALVVEFTR